MQDLSINSRTSRIITSGALAVLVVFGASQNLAAQQSVQFANTRSDDAEVTFTADIAPILQANCQVCHQAGAIGPMALMTYQDARRWSARIRNLVVAREMPPYQYDTDVGIQDLKYDPRLSDEDIATVVAWVEQGSLEGDPNAMPAPITWPDPGEFRLADRFGRQPDVIVRSTPYDVPAVGQDRWWQPVVDAGIPADRCIQAIETKPSVEGRAVAHHANSNWVGGTTRVSGMLSEYALGKIGEIIPEGACRTAPGGAQVRFDIHYWPNGVDLVDDQVEIGIWLHPEGYLPEYQQDLTLYRLSGGRGYDIAPHGTLMTRGTPRSASTAGSRTATPGSWRCRWRSCGRTAAPRRSAWSRTGARSGITATSMTMTWRRSWMWATRSS